jgi:hypothetical protein
MLGVPRALLGELGAERQQRILPPLAVGHQAVDEALANAEYREAHLGRFQLLEQALQDHGSIGQHLAPRLGDVLDAMH